MNTKTKDWILGLFFIGFFLWVIIYGFTQRNNLNKSHVLGVAMPYECSSGGRGSSGRLFIDYYYTVESKKYKSTLNITTGELSQSDCNYYFIGRTFPVAYEPGNPSNSLLLIRAVDFERFGVPFPDSLRWYLKFLH